MASSSRRSQPSPSSLLDLTNGEGGDNRRSTRMSASPSSSTRNRPRIESLSSSHSPSTNSTVSSSAEPVIHSSTLPYASVPNPLRHHIHYPNHLPEDQMVEEESPERSPENEEITYRDVDVCDERDGDESDGAGGGGGDSILNEGSIRRDAKVNRLSTSSSVTNVPKGPHVVETGHEQTGRWTNEEHSTFLSALKLYGKEWKKVAAVVKTRTVVQTRTHAQKYFQKLQKSKSSPSSKQGSHRVHMDSAVMIGIDDAASDDEETTKLDLLTNASSPATTAADISRGRRKASRSSSSTTLNAAQVISGLASRSYTTTDHTSTLTGESNNISGIRGNQMPPLSNPLPLPSRLLHGFSSSHASSSSITSATIKVPSLMKITAPDPTHMLKTSAFPEPSPAATGKRKLAEIAAARMLAGVAMTSTTNSISAAHRTLTNTFFWDEDGPPTPPPDLSSSFVIGRGSGQGGLAFSSTAKMPSLPVLDALTSDGIGSHPRSTYQQRTGLSLQIVNPESLGVPYDQTRTAHSPVTPWDGQLEALVNSTNNSACISSLENAELLPLMPVSSSTSPVNHLTTTTAAAMNSSYMHTHAVVDLKHGYGRTPFHVAVCKNNIDSAKEILQQLQQQSALSPEELVQYVTRVDTLGYAPLHTACALLLRLQPQPAVDSSSEFESVTKEVVTDVPFVSDGSGCTARNMVSYLVQEAGSHAKQSDRNGSTPLHWAARAGDTSVVECLLLQADVNARNSEGETPLHWALRSGRKSRRIALSLLSSGARINVLNNCYRRPIDVAGEGFLDDKNSLASLMAQFSAGKKVKKDLNRAQKEAKADRRDSRVNLFNESSHSRTLVLHHPECLEHHPKSESDWETPDRVLSIMQRLLPIDDSCRTSQILPQEINISQEFDRANLDLLKRIHSTEYLSFVHQLSKELERQLKENGTSLDEDPSFSFPTPVVPFTPMVQRSIIKFDDASVKCGLSSDTSFSVGSLKAARRAAGAVQHAVDCVLVGRNRNAFCVVRPPGHHAGINGLLEGGESCGFCIFNNVAAGALYATSDDRLLCSRCAIVDIDVHHGNGTEEIVRRCHDPRKLFFFSIHLFDNEKRKKNGDRSHYKFYPGTGDEDDLALNIINVPIVPLWKESSLSNTITRSHNTRQKKIKSTQETLEDSSETETERISDGGSTPVEIAPTNPPISASGMSGRLAYRQSIQSRLLPALRAFNPDLILISAGFDASKGDVGNARHERGRERIGLDLEPEDYAWTTRKILQIADICCHGRVVSVLEGGYGRTPIAPQIIPSHGNCLDRTMFSECAIRHLQALIDPYDIEARFP